MNPKSYLLNYNNLFFISNNKLEILIELKYKTMSDKKTKNVIE